MALKTLKHLILNSLQSIVCVISQAPVQRLLVVFQTLKQLFAFLPATRINLQYF